MFWSSPRGKSLCSGTSQGLVRKARNTAAMSKWLASLLLNSSLLGAIPAGKGQWKTSAWIMTLESQKSNTIPSVPQSISYLRDCERAGGCRKICAKKQYLHEEKAYIKSGLRNITICKSSLQFTKVWGPYQNSTRLPIKGAGFVSITKSPEPSTGPDT